MSIDYCRIDQIVDEVFELMDSSLFEDLFDSVRLAKPVPKLDKKFDEIIKNIESYTSLELAVYLRTSSSRKDVCNYWLPLLTLSVGRSAARGEEYQDIFYGLM